MAENEIDLIDKLAELRILGGFKSKYQMGRAINIAFKQINKRHKDEPQSVTFASIAQQIKNFWENDFNKWAQTEGKKNLRYGKKQDKKVEEFISIFRQLINEFYNGSLTNAYRYRFNIMDAYVWKLSHKGKKEVS